MTATCNRGAFQPSSILYLLPPSRSDSSTVYSLYMHSQSNSRSKKWEYMDCKFCRATFVSWDNWMLAQLADGVGAYFPVTLTRKYACDHSVVTLLRAHTHWVIIPQPCAIICKSCIVRSGCTSSFATSLIVSTTEKGYSSRQLLMRTPSLSLHFPSLIGFWLCT